MMSSHMMHDEHLEIGTRQPYAALHEPSVDVSRVARPSRSRRASNDNGVMTLDEAVEMLRDEHDAWHARIASWADETHGVVIPRPRAEIVTRTAKWSAQYSPSSATCSYQIGYVLLVGREYRETVAHEMVHHAQKLVMPESQWHGDFFKYLLRFVCGFRGAKTTHSESPRAARLLGETVRQTLGHERWDLFAPRPQPGATSFAEQLASLTPTKRRA